MPMSFCLPSTPYEFGIALFRTLNVAQNMPHALNSCPVPPRRSVKAWTELSTTSTNNTITSTAKPCRTLDDEREGAANPRSYRTSNEMRQYLSEDTPFHSSVIEFADFCTRERLGVRRLDGGFFAKFSSPPCWVCGGRSDDRCGLLLGPSNVSVSTFQASKRPSYSEER